MPAVDQPSTTVLLNVAAAADPEDWRDISTRQLKWTVNGPSRRRVLDRYSVGTSTVELDNADTGDGLGDRPFDPTNASSPFYPNLKPYRGLKIGLGYLALVLAAAPAVYLRVGEASGTSAADESGNDNTGAYVGSPTLAATGVITDNTAVTLNGSSQYISVADDATLDTGDTFTFEGWIKRANTTAGTYTIADRGSGSFRVDLNSSHQIRLQKSHSGLTIVTSTTTIADTNWHHVAVTKSGATAKIYIDGQDVSGAVSNQTLVDSTTALVFGAVSPAAQHFPGSLDELAVYPTALTAAQILDHYEEGLGGFADGWVFTGEVEGWPRQWSGRNSDTMTISATDASARLNRVELHSVHYDEVLADTPKGWWRLGEDSGTTMTDSSGNGHHGVYEGGVTFSSRDGLVDGDSDNALDFDGVDDRGVAPSTAAITDGSFSVEAWYSAPNPSAPSRTIAFQGTSIQFGSAGLESSIPTYQKGWWLGIEVDPLGGSGTTLAFMVGDGSAVRHVRATLPTASEPHHIVATYNAGTTNIYVDGVAQALTTVTGGSPAAPTTGPVYIGNDPTLTGTWFDGIIDEVAVYDSVLSAARVDAHYDAATIPWASDLPGARAEKILDAADWPAARRDLDTGTTTMPAVDVQGRKAWDALLQVGDAEIFGGIYVDGAGNVVLVDRSSMWTDTRRTTSQATFGDEASGYVPYYGPVRADFSAAEVASRAIVSRSGGSTATAEDATARSEFGVVEISKTGLPIEDDVVVQSAAQFLATEFADPVSTIPAISLRPGSASGDTAAAAAWRQAVVRRLGDRVTVNPPDGSAAIEALVEGKRWSVEGRKVECSFTLGRPLQVAVWVLGTSELGTDTIPGF